LTTGFDVADVSEVMLTEAPLAAGLPRARAVAHDGRSIGLELRPFQIVTLRLGRQRANAAL
jgi:hypothetical protein